MGNTCASVHIALTGTTPDAIEAIVSAYATLGFERANTASPDGGKHVVLLRQEDDAFVSVYDSDNAALDTGELKDLALTASKIFKTVAVCTSLYDSDTFEVVVFHGGKQVDLVMTNPEQYNGPLKILSDRSRAARWSKVFGKPLSVDRITQAISTNSAFCRSLFEQVDRAALEAVARITETNDAFRIALRDGQGLDDLELALLPVLPVESVRLHKQ